MSITTQTPISKLSGFPPTLPHVPSNYQSLIKRPGLLAVLLNDNSDYLYNEFSPYTSKGSILNSVVSDRQPFVYRHIDDSPNRIFSEVSSFVQSLPQSININRRNVSDVVRVSRFMGSSLGNQFIINQASLQLSAPFDETRVYNPLSPIQATLLPPRPTRHVVESLFGVIDAITGINFQTGYPTPSSTVGDSALPQSIVGTGQGTGLIRGADAGKGFAQIQMAWPVSNPNNFGGNGLVSSLASMASTMANSAASMFLTTNISQPPGTKVRADEGTYGYMATSYKLGLRQEWFPSLKVTIDNPPYSPSPLSSINNAISTVLSTATSILSNPIGSAGGILVNLLGNSTMGNQGLKRTKLIALPNSQFIQKNVTNGVTGLPFNVRISDGLGKNNNSSNTQTGYSISDGNKYGSDVGRPLDTGTLTNSDTLVQYSYYVNKQNNYTSKFSDPTSATLLNNNLQTILKDINLTQTYYASNSPASYLLPGFSGQNNQYVSYDNWTQKQQSAQTVGASGEYSNGNTSNPPTVDAFVSKTNNLRMATAFYSDGINMLGIVPKNLNISNTLYPKWTQYRPYYDDTIAFFFYDVVNEKYIPFRATVKGISEGNTAFWDELRFVGRADQLYSYNGFSRTLSFTFNVVISSITELLPSWKKINYIASAVKPSNYTQGQNVNQTFNRFIVPPMFMLTIGDLYKFQPVIMTSINVNVPDDASWETLDEINSNQWSYLNGLITSPNLGKNYGQLPREVEVAVTCNLLEKERAYVGGSHFGHQPRVDDWEGINNTSDRFLTGSNSIPYLPSITTFHQSLVEWNNSGSIVVSTMKQPTTVAQPSPYPTYQPQSNGPTKLGNTQSSPNPTPTLGEPLPSQISPVSSGHAQREL